MSDDLDERDKRNRQVSVEDGGTASGGDMEVSNVEAFTGRDATVVKVQTPPQQRERGCPMPPPPSPHFTGRGEHLAELSDLITSDDEHILIAIQGMGGIGKTSLACKFAEEALSRKDVSCVFWATVSRRPSVGQILLEWAGYADPHFALDRAVGRLLKGADRPGARHRKQWYELEQEAHRVRSLVTRLVKEKCPGRALVVLDDVWPESVNEARLLLEAVPMGAAIVVTTRSRDVARRLRCKVVKLRKLSQEESEGLLKRLVDAGPASDEQIRRMAGLMGGHPLALELAAGAISMREDEEEVWELIDRYEKGLKEGISFEEIGLDIGEGKKDSLAASFRVSYEEMGEDMRRMFRALGVLAPDAGFDERVAALIWDEEVEAAKKALMWLRGRSMVTGLGGGRYEQHVLLRAYAGSLLRSEGEFDEVMGRFVAAVTDMVGRYLAGRVREVLGGLEEYAGPEAIEMPDVEGDDRGPIEAGLN